MSRKIAYGGILLGLNIIILLLVNIIPINTLFLLGLASLPLSIIIMEFGPRIGIIYYFASIILSLVMTNKAQWILYIFTFGLYGLVKYFIEKDRNIFVEYGLKLICANILIFISYMIVKAFVYVPVNLITIIIFEISFLVYDYVYSMFIDYYNKKLRRITKIS